jgi:hypothetical protein
MSELINNTQKRKELLKHLILQLHDGQAPAQVKNQLRSLLGQVPYDQVVEVEQELIAEGLPQEEVLKLCDVHSEVLKGSLDSSRAQTAPPGHPAHTFLQENRLLAQVTAALLGTCAEPGFPEGAASFWDAVRGYLRSLSDVEKHYQRKENLLFPYLEKHGITGPPSVMWGKHDETRALLRRAQAAAAAGPRDPKQAEKLIEEALKPVALSVDEMIFKEENILFPMCLDTLTEAEWHEIYRQSPDVGFCLYDPQEEWQPAGAAGAESAAGAAGAAPAAAGGQPAGERLHLPSGSFSPVELEAVLNSLTVDMTFVDADDTVRYFNQAKDRIFTRTRAIIGRKVQQCHPPDSVHVVERILADFKAGRQERAAFWINLGGKFVHIEYVALRDKEGKYLGTLEISQDLAAKRALQGERRLLSY